jgi:hypothetical protein
MGTVGVGKWCCRGVAKHFRPTCYAYRQRLRLQTVPARRCARMCTHPCQEAAMWRKARPRAVNRHRAELGFRSQGSSAGSPP